MNRIRLRLFTPPEEPAAAKQVLMDTDRPHVLPFRSSREATVISGRFTPPADRARIIRDNCRCPECELTDVEPLELEDGLVSQRNHRPVPGTATIVGFHCNHCGTEWPVYELVSRRNG
ncbi:MAG: hypothetical protein ABGZ17_15690 [Planctomycetaceae bacterium]|jgi:hypothetical protein